MNDEAYQNQSEFDLLGYVLDALDERDCQRIESALQNDPCLALELEQVRREVVALDADLGHGGHSGLVSPSPIDRFAFPLCHPMGSAVDESPPAGLARRTSSWIAALPSLSLKAWEHTKKSTFFSSTSDSLGKRTGWSLRDFAGLAIAGLILGMIIIPAISMSRFQSHRTSCQNNLREIGVGLLSSANLSSGMLIEFPKDERLAIAGSYAPALLASGFIQDPQIFLCSGNGLEQQPRSIPTFEQMRNGSHDELLAYQEQAGGDYAFNIGYFENQAYVPPQILNRTQHILLADAPSIDLPGRASSHHGNRGQNVLFEDGRTAFLASPAIGVDSIYENDWAQIAPGIHVNDNILAPSRTRLNLVPQR